MAKAPTQWSTGLCSCDDFGLLCSSFWFPCITFGQIAEIVDSGETSCKDKGTAYALIAGCGCIFSFTYRSKMRAQYNIEGTVGNDFCTHFWCEPCALYQMHRELTVRGFDMGIGWRANVERQTVIGTPVPPTPHPEMKR